MQALVEKRAELDLHISLLAEHEVTRIITLVTAIAERMGVDKDTKKGRRRIPKAFFYFKPS